MHKDGGLLEENGVEGGEGEDGEGEGGVEKTEWSSKGGVG